MVLEQDQIRQLYIWVHPGYRLVEPSLLQEWRTVIEILEYEPRVALLETSTVHHPVSNEPIFYGPYTDRFFRHTMDPAVDNDRHLYMVQVGELERLAQTLLGERFQLWPHGSFVEMDKTGKTTLKSKFNLAARRLSPDTNKLVVDTFCYGLESYACVPFQHTQCSLQTISQHVHGRGNSPLTNFPFSISEEGYIEGIPST